MENVYDNPVLKKIQGFLCLSFGLLCSCRNFYKNRTLIRKLEKENFDMKKILEAKIAIGRLLSFASVRSWAIITHKVYSLCKNNNSKYVSIPTGRKHYFGEMYLREGMVNTVKMPFEGRQWNVAKDYDNYFKTLYGPDYMTPPPPEKRESHVLFELKFPEE
jgi:lipopolysaccharide cholinephosphotransferase